MEKQLKIIEKEVENYKKAVENYRKVDENFRKAVESCVKVTPLRFYHGVFITNKKPCPELFKK